MISNDSESTEENIYIILYIFTMWPYWPTLKQLNPLPRGHGFHNSGRSLHGNHIHVISFMPPPPFIRIKALVINGVGRGSGGCPFTFFVNTQNLIGPRCCDFGCISLKCMENDFLFTLMTLQF